jgi:creatinine amidohydrolase
VNARDLPLDLLDLSHGEARALLARDVPVYLPVNPVEFHGPHLSLRNDHLCGMGLAADLHARLAPKDGGPWPFVVASSIEAGAEPCPGPGTRPTTFLALRRLVLDACAGLVELGVRRVVLVTFHGAPLHAHALDAGVQLLARHGVRAIQPHNLLMTEMMNVDAASYAEAFAHVEDPAERAEMMDGLSTDFHAGFGETSIALHYAPASVGANYRTLPPCPRITPDPPFVVASRLARAAGKAQLATELWFAAVGRGWLNLRPFPGYTSRPHRATAAAGAVFARRIVDEYEKATRAVFAGAAGPLPIMPWVVKASLGGLVPTGSVPLSAVAGYA